MIKLSKLSEPAVLRDNKSKWTRELMIFVYSGSKIPESVQNRYNQPEVKQKLIEETNGKCMYCESPIGHITYEHIEHYRPKSAHKFPALTFDWSNLGLACPICNMKKKDEFDENCSFVNPYIDDPNDFFVALGHFVYHKPNTPRAELTEKLLELNRTELIERRKERIDAIRRLVELWAKESNPIIKRVIAKEIEIESQDDKPYSMCVRSIIKAMNCDLPF